MRRVREEGDEGVAAVADWRSSCGAVVMAAEPLRAASLARQPKAASPSRTLPTHVCVSSRQPSDFFDASNGPEAGLCSSVIPGRYSSDPAAAASYCEELRGMSVILVERRTAVFSGAAEALEVRVGMR